MKYFVKMIDKFMSGWGQAQGKKNYFVVECNTLGQAEAIFKAAHDRPEMKYIDIVTRFPTPRNALVSVVKFELLTGKWRQYI